MNQKVGLLLILVLIPMGISLALVPGTQKQKENEKAERNRSTKQKEKFVCCELDDRSQGDLRLARICQGAQTTRITFKYDTPSNGACEILENVTLEDDSGHKYRSIGSQGIPRCGSDKRWRVEEFIWVFEKMNLQAKHFNLYEKDLETMSGWRWNHIELNHCKFQIFTPSGNP